MIELVPFVVCNDELPPQVQQFDTPIRDLVEEVYPTTPRGELLCHIPGLCLLALTKEVASSPVGVANLTLDAPDEFGMDTAWIDTLVVSPQRRQRGLHIGSVLVDRVVSLAQKEGASAIGIEATETSVDFWRKQGFRSVQPQPPVKGIFTEVMCRFL